MNECEWIEFLVERGYSRANITSPEHIKLFRELIQSIRNSEVTFGEKLCEAAGGKVVIREGRKFCLLSAKLLKETCMCDKIWVQKLLDC